MGCERYRDVNPALGTINDLREVISALHEAGISAVVDFIFNHTSNEHEWAKGCVGGDQSRPLFCAAQEIGDAAGEGDNREVFQPKDGTPTSLVSVLTP